MPDTSKRVLKLSNAHQENFFVNCQSRLGEPEPELDVYNRFIMFEDISKVENKIGFCGIGYLPLKVELLGI